MAFSEIAPGPTDLPDNLHGQEAAGAADTTTEQLADSAQAPEPDSWMGGTGDQVAVASGLLDSVEGETAAEPTQNHEPTGEAAAEDEPTRSPTALEDSGADHTGEAGGISGMSDTAETGAAEVAQPSDAIAGEAAVTAAAQDIEDAPTGGEAVAAGALNPQSRDEAQEAPGLTEASIEAAQSDHRTVRVTEHHRAEAGYDDGRHTSPEEIRGRFETLQAMRAGDEAAELPSELVAVGHIEPATLSRPLLDELFLRRFVEEENGLLSSDDPFLQDSEIRSLWEAFTHATDADLAESGITAWSRETTRVSASFNGWPHLPWHIDIPQTPMVRWTATIGTASTRVANGLLRSSDLKQGLDDMVRPGDRLQPAPTVPPGTVLRLLPGTVHASPDPAPRVFLQRSIHL